ncbi:transmembrane amino acid transporter protein-domain-containing protein [Lobosporangium transversale]|uniref:Transmembrane amino acid transporter protein-domain-containing protein n=1 Tax=Lobosporangium transversale TaxID=64571 RepID=A0A1Y2GLL8_9FUNG|nr:transmembrane amino acid transporter protein-domain-containing protein [Lobosporangium transversale]ORZ14864.1 transmembrane amino acid transporter protein-domain-containing protein [Lobosporangium transversale]|eukprot:XP_021880996.1 transmembrane amino acid transporter protein-domain-containing protein [Lobosporangium transversale]
MTGNRTNRSGIGNRPDHGHDIDPEAKLPDHGGNLLSSFLNMANSIIGAGLPFAFQEAGLGMGVLLLCLITWIVDWTVGLLVHSAKLSGRSTYQDLLMFCFGKAGLISISLFQFIFAFGAMCAYTVIVGDTLPHVLQALIPGIEDWPLLGFIARRSFVITFCTVMISYPLSLYRDISKLAKTSAVAMLALVIIIIAVMIEGPRAPIEMKGDPDAVWSFARPKVFQSIGVISFAFVCHHNSFLIFSSLQKPTINRVKLVTHMSMVVSLLACLILALSGYLSFSDMTQGNILNNFASDNFIINIARFCFGVNMFTTLPLEAFVCREVIETYYFPGLPFSIKRHFIITTGLVGVALFIALLTCNLGFVLEVTGGFSATALAFILPPMCYLKLVSGPLWSTKKLPHLMCVGFGIAVMILSTFFSLQHFMEPKDAGASSCSV